MQQLSSLCNLAFNSHAYYLQGKNQIAKEHLSLPHVNVFYDGTNKIKHDTITRTRNTITYDLININLRTNDMPLGRMGT